ncbi:MAG: type III-A CRISPR-associated RAMP protein Csm4 [Acetobacteraceae bacterium]
MALFRVRLRLTAPLGTPLTSGTIFGHFCWAYRDTHGEAALEKWLRALPENPWMVSDGFPAEHLPRPLIPPVADPAVRPEKMTKEKLKAFDDDKKRRKFAFIPRARWRDLRVGMTPGALAEQACRAPVPAGHRIAHNTIDRRTATTPDAGGLWFVDEFWPCEKAASVDIYVRAAADAKEIGALFRAVGAAGYGRDASTGRGAFEVAAIEAESELDSPPRTGGALRMLSLSHGSIGANMQDACYKVAAHFGKVGRSMLASVPRPWKLPILLARPGATFIPGDDGPFGAWLTGVHQDRPEIGHNAWHLAIPFTLAGRA